MTLSELFKNIADAIRDKEGSTDSIPATDFASRISAIETGVDTSDATATAADIADGKIAYVNGEKVVGNVSESTSFVVSGTPMESPNSSSKFAIRWRGYTDYLFRDGNHYFQAEKSEFGDATAADVAKGKTFTSEDGLAVTGTYESPEPSIEVSSSGLITATSGDKSATKQLTTKAATTITPGTSSKTAVSSGVYTTGAITVAGDSELVMNNIKNGVEIFGVIGSYTGRSVKIGTFDSSVSVGYSNFNGSRFVITFPSGFDASSVVAFNLGGFRNGNYTTQPMIGILDENSNSIKAHLYNYNSNVMNGLSLYHWASGSSFSMDVNQLVCSALDTAVSNIFQYAGYGYYVYLE